MRKLLRANFSRLLGDRGFWISAAFMFLMGIYFPVSHFLNRDTDWMMDYSFFTFVFLAAVLTAVWTALFVGSEYSNGTLRNKLIAGHRRSSIYLANWIVCTAAGLLLCISHMVPHAVLGHLFSCRFEADLETVFLYIALSFAVTAVFAALFAMIAMLCQNKSYTVAACLLLTGALLLWGVQITSALNEPEYFEAYSYTENGVTVAEPAMRNPNYLTGTKRQVYEFLEDFTPGGQALQVANMNAPMPALLALYDAVIVLAATGCGLIVFRHRDLK